MVKINNANTPGICPIPKTATKTAANNKSGMVRTIFKIKRDGTVIHFVLQYYLQRAMQLELMRWILRMFYNRHANCV